MALTGGKPLTVEGTRLTHSTTLRKAKGSAQQSSPRGFPGRELIRPLGASPVPASSPDGLPARGHTDGWCRTDSPFTFRRRVRRSVCSGHFATNSGVQRAVAHVCCESGDLIERRADLLVVVAGIDFPASPQPFQPPTYPSPSSTSTPLDPPPQSKLRLRDRL